MSLSASARSGETFALRSDRRREKFRDKLLEVLKYDQCLKICFRDTSRVVRDFYCALQIIADGVSGKSQRSKRLTAYGEFGEAPSNKGMQKMLVEMASKAEGHQAKGNPSIIQCSPRMFVASSTSDT